MEKKLTTILCSDVIGYSKMMGADEVGTLKKLEDCRTIIDPLIAKHNGRIFNTAGDSILSEFSSPSDAVEFAVAMQFSIMKLNSDMRWRVGIHLGEVFSYGDNLLGDTVNIAARIESTADYGGVCMSATVYNFVAPKLKDLMFESRGTQTFKNIDRPVEIWAVKVPGSELNPNAATPKPSARLREDADLVKAVLHDRAAQNRSFDDAINFKRDKNFNAATRILMWRITRKCNPSLNELIEISEKNLVPTELKECVVAIFKEYCLNIDSDRTMRIAKLLRGNLGEFPSLSLKFLASAARTNTDAQLEFATIILDNPHSGTVEIKKAIEHLEEAAKHKRVEAMIRLADYYESIGDQRDAFRWLWVARGLRDSTAQIKLEKLSNKINRADFQTYKYDAEALLDEVKFKNDPGNYKY